MDGDILDRGDFDRAVNERFPGARRSRKETDQGWADTFVVGLLQVQITVQEAPRSEPLPWGPTIGTMTLKILGIRKSIDGSTTALWQEKADGWEESCAALDALREELLGMAHALYVSCKAKPGDKPPKDKELSELAALWDAQPDLSKMF